MSISVRRVKESDFKTMEKIFFESSSVAAFQNSSEEQSFKAKYFTFYLDNYLKYCSVIEVDSVIAGYLIYCPDSLEMLSLNPTLSDYRDELDSFPAHLHMNVSDDFQSKGLGSFLLNESLLNISPNRPVHIITGEKARNINFYLQNNFKIIKSLKGTSFLGRIDASSN